MAGRVDPEKQKLEEEDAGVLSSVICTFSVLLHISVKQLLQLWWCWCIFRTRQDQVVDVLHLAPLLMATMQSASTWTKFWKALETSSWRKLHGIIYFQVWYCLTGDGVWKKASFSGNLGTSQVHLQSYGLPLSLCSSTGMHQSRTGFFSDALDKVYNYVSITVMSTEDWYWHQRASIKGHCPFPQEYCGGWRKDKTRPLVIWVSTLSFHLCEAMLARALAVALCLSVYLSSRCSVKRDGWIDLVFGMEASFDQSYNIS